MAKEKKKSKLKRALEKLSEQRIQILEAFFFYKNT